MKVSLAWLKELVDITMPVERFAHALTMGGLEVEEIEAVAADFSGIVVAQVKRVAPHPNAECLMQWELRLAMSTWLPAFASAMPRLISLMRFMGRMLALGQAQSSV